MGRIPNALKICGITYWEYRELLAFCHSYEDKKRAAHDLLGVGSPEMSGMPKGNAVGRPTESTAMKRLRYLEDIEMIEKAARETGEGKWYIPLMQNCCHGVSWKHLDPASMPTSDRNSFFDARGEFFVRLWFLRFNTLRYKDP